MLSIVVNLSGLLLIGLIVWWFTIAKPKAKKLRGNTIDIVVHDGVYEPAIIRAKQGKRINLRFLRKDPSPCAKFVIFNDLNISAELPIDEPHMISLDLNKTGEFEFTCQMGMYRGKLLVE